MLPDVVQERYQLQIQLSDGADRRVMFRRVVDERLIARSCGVQSPTLLIMKLTLYHFHAN